MSTKNKKKPLSNAAIKKMALTKQVKAWRDKCAILKENIKNYVAEVEEKEKENDELSDKIDRAQYSIRHAINSVETASSSLSDLESDLDG